MLAKKLTYLTLLLGVACYGHAQDSLMLRDYQFMKQQNAWLTNSNASGLTRFNTKNIAEAEVILSHDGRSLTEFGGSNNILQASACVESFYRISNKAVTYGAISYDNWTGRNMAGSTFMQRRLPFDIVEETQDNTGRKHRDTYQLTGAVGIDLWHGYSIGARLDYMAGNYAKYKDLRHRNRLMDLTLSFGASAPILNWLTIGANYQYHRTTESVAFSMYGREDKVYKSIIAYGAFMGRTEQFGSTGYTDANREMPLVEDQNGGALQLELRPFYHTAGILRTLTVFANASLCNGTGYYGRKSPYTITYTHHERDITTFHGRLSLSTRKSRHQLDLNYASEKLSNYAENYREQTNGNGAKYYEYYDPTETGDKHWSDFGADYTLHTGIRGERPTWAITAGYHWQRRKQTAYYYPYFRYQTLTTNILTVSASRNIITQRGVWTLTLDGGYQKGSGKPYTDGTFATPSSKQEAPADMETYLYQEYHQLTSPQYSVGTQVKYSFQNPGIPLLTHIRSALHYQRATTIPADYCGQERTTVTIAIGCTF